MPVREFVDHQGRAWRVWSTVPSVPSAITAGYEQGWLTFQAGDELRRYAPIPAGWEQLSDERLDVLCRVAESAATRLTPPRGSPRDPGDAEAR